MKEQNGQLPAKRASMQVLLFDQDADSKSLDPSSQKVQLPEVSMSYHRMNPLGRSGRKALACCSAKKHSRCRRCLAVRGSSYRHYKTRQKDRQRIAFKQQAALNAATRQLHSRPPGSGIMSTHSGLTSETAREVEGHTPNRHHRTGEGVWISASTINQKSSRTLPKCRHA